VLAPPKPSFEMEVWTSASGSKGCTHNFFIRLFTKGLQVKYNDQIKPTILQIAKPKKTDEADDYARATCPDNTPTSLI
jgi:hypothetical protein